jgi:hypothetical protein
VAVHYIEVQTSWREPERHWRHEGPPVADRQAYTKFMWRLLPVDDNRVRWGFIPVAAAFLVTTSTEMERKHKSDTVRVGLQVT